MSVTHSMALMVDLIFVAGQQQLGQLAAASTVSGHGLDMGYCFRGISTCNWRLRTSISSFFFSCLNIAGRVIDQGWALTRIYIREPRESMRLTASITMYIETARQKSNFLGLKIPVGQLIIDTTPHFFLYTRFYFGCIKKWSVCNGVYMSCPWYRSLSTWRGRRMWRRKSRGASHAASWRKHPPVKVEHS